METTMPKKSDPQLEAFDKACDDNCRRHDQIQILRGKQAVLTLQVLQLCAHDIWGSADLHFDGDCFGEHEWHVIMRGGGLAMERSHASGKTALEAVLAALAVKIKEYRGEAKKRMQRHLRLHLQEAATIEAALKALKA